MWLKYTEYNIFSIFSQIPAEVSKAFHVICDTHNPIAENVIIFLTLTIPDDDEKGLFFYLQTFKEKKNATKQIVYLILGNVDSIAEDTLFKLWGSKLKHYELDPLIARVAEQVIALN